MSRWFVKYLVWSLFFSPPQNIHTPIVNNNKKDHKWNLSKAQIHFGISSKDVYSDLSKSVTHVVSQDTYEKLQLREVELPAEQLFWTVYIKLCLVRMLVCVGASVCVCVCVRAHMLRIVSRDKILCFKNTFIIIIIMRYYYGTSDDK